MMRLTIETNPFQRQYIETTNKNMEINKFKVCLQTIAVRSTGILLFFMVVLFFCNLLKILTLFVFSMYMSMTILPSSIMRFLYSLTLDLLPYATYHPIPYNINNMDDFSGKYS